MSENSQIEYISNSFVKHGFDFVQHYNLNNNVMQGTHAEHYTFKKFNNIIKLNILISNKWNTIYEIKCISLNDNDITNKIQFCNGCDDIIHEPIDNLVDDIMKVMAGLNPPSRLDRYIKTHNIDRNRLCSPDYDWKKQPNNIGPIIHKVQPQLYENILTSVVPLDEPVGLRFAMKFLSI